MNEDQIKHMVQRFLSWRLPEPWRPDAGISFEPSFPAEPMRSRHWPTGTNLFDAMQAEAMVRHLLAGCPEAPHQPAEIGEMVERLRRAADNWKAPGYLQSKGLFSNAADLLERLSRQPGEDERESFEQRYRHLDLTREVSPTWGASRYKHSHVEAIWEGWSARAALSARPVQEGAKNTEEMPEVAAIRYLNDLRGSYGASVTILSDDEEAWATDKQMAIDVCGEWTDWTPRRYWGESILQCAAKAVTSRDQLAAIRARGDGRGI